MDVGSETFGNVEFERKKLQGPELRPRCNALGHKNFFLKSRGFCLDSIDF